MLTLGSGKHIVSAVLEYDFRTADIVRRQGVLTNVSFPCFSCNKLLEEPFIYNFNYRVSSRTLFPIVLSHFNYVGCGNLTSTGKAPSCYHARCQDCCTAT